MSDEGMGGDMLERYARGEASVPIPTFTRDVYRHLLARLDAAERERDALREIVASDSPLGRNGVPSHKEIARRALKGIDHE